MNDAFKKALVKNAWLVALADGKLHPDEERWVRALIDAAGVTETQAQTWFNELLAGQLGFEEVADREEATRMLKLAVGIVAADGRLDRREASALVDLGKALGFSLAEIEAVYHETWGMRTLDEIVPARTAPVAAGACVVVEDDFAEVEAFVSGAPHLAFERRWLRDLVRSPGQPAVVIFHAAAERPATVERVGKLKARLPDAKRVLVVHRHQANQISYALEAGVRRCLVEPIFHGEVAALFSRLDEA